VKTAYRGLLWSLILATLILGLAVSDQVSAQIISGDLVGTILDKTGAVVPGSRVEATKTDTGVKYETKANESGEYRFNNLPVGVYSISASTPNFATTTINGFRVELNKTSTLQITLEVKGAVTSIEVSGSAAALDTTTSQLQSTFESKDIADSAIASTGGTGSGVLNLSLLSAGVGTSGGVGVGSGPSVGGQRPRNNNFTIEGVDNNNKGVTGPLVAVPNDAVAEFSLLQNQFSPEFGHSSGGQFNTVVKSGTNSFHGLAYVYNANRNYDAFDSLNGVGGLTSNPRFDNNRFGGQIGGPVLKNKLFFFVNYEQEPLGQAGTAGAVCSPTAASFAVINSTPGLSATNLAIFEKYVAPGTTDPVQAGCSDINWDSGPGGKLPTAGLAVLAPSFINYRFVTTSMDYDLSSRDQIRGRYIYNSNVGIDNSAALPAFYLSQPQKFHLITLNEYHTFSPTLTNEVRIGFNRFASITSAGNFSFPGLDSFPNLLFVDLGNLQIGPDTSAPQSTVQNTYQVAEAITWTKNAHTLKFGIEGRKLISPQTFTQRVRGDYEYNDLQTFLQDGVADSLAQRSNGNAVYYGDQSAVYWYANDNWRIRRNFTLNLGLRYEYTTIPFTQRSQSLNAAASVPGLINFAAPQAAKNDWGPRIGFAYSPGASGRTSIRAGAGIAYDVLFDNLGLLSLPPQLSSTIDCAPVGNFPCPTSGFLASGGILPGPGGIATFPTIAAQRQKTSAFVPVNQKSPKSLDWTLGIQHTFWNDFTGEIRYVGTRGIHLPAQIQLNKQPKVNSSFFLPTYTTAPSQATLDASTVDLATIQATSALVPAYGSAGFLANITSYQPWASSTYHGLAAQLNKRFSHGFQMIGAYTYSHLIDDATAEVFSTVLAPRRAQNGLNLSADRSNSILDHRHRVTLSVVYDEPFFRNSNAFLRNTVGGWEIAPIYTYQSGQWVTAQSAVDSNLNGDSAGDRPIFNPGGVSGTGSGVVPLCTSAVAVCPTTLTAANKNKASRTGVVGYLATNPTAQYIDAGFGALSNVGRSTLQLKPINDVDVSVLKRFVITERFKVEFRASATNVLNHRQYVGGYLNDVQPQNPTFIGTQRNMLIPDNASFNDPSAVFSSNPRTLQLALKIFF
jgi:hypothetical protein